MKRIKLGYVDFFPGFQITKQYYYRFLSRYYDIEIDNEHPDYLFFSVFGNKHLSYTNCIKIFWTGECQSPDFNFCDYAIGFDELSFGDRYFRYPLYFQYEKDYEQMCHKHQFDLADLKQKSGFCSFVYSNTNASSKRQQIYDALAAYRPIASGGRYHNNVGGPVADKIEFQSKYKFCIACENASMPGYSTEKLVQAFASKTIPIYWGDPHIAAVFNPKSFINVSDFETLEQLVEYVQKIDSDDALYLEMLRQPALLDMQLKDKKEQELKVFLENIFEQDPLKAQRYNRVYWGERLRYQRVHESKAYEKSIIMMMKTFYNKYLFVTMRDHFPKVHQWLMKQKNAAQS